MIDANAVRLGQPNEQAQDQCRSSHTTRWANPKFDFALSVQEMMARNMDQSPGQPAVTATIQASARAPTVDVIVETKAKRKDDKRAQLQSAELVTRQRAFRLLFEQSLTNAEIAVQSMYMHADHKLVALRLELEETKDLQIKTNQFLQL